MLEYQYVIIRWSKRSIIIQSNIKPFRIYWPDQLQLHWIMVPDSLNKNFIINYKKKKRMRMKKKMLPIGRNKCTNCYQLNQRWKMCTRRWSEAFIRIRVPLITEISDKKINNRLCNQIALKFVTGSLKHWEPLHVWYRESL